HAHILMARVNPGPVVGQQANRVKDHPTDNWLKILPELFYNLSLSVNVSGICPKIGKMNVGGRSGDWL
ncbi:MAG: hypothetical protein ACP5QG_06115, partial [candidate division WOR-3 bacterium]